MIRTFKLLVFGGVCFCLAACGGKGEIGPATTTPQVDKKKMDEEMRKSFEKGKPKGVLPKAS
jgi:hypothetical protein